jgi:hypothetical protein
MNPKEPISKPKQKRRLCFDMKLMRPASVVLSVAMDAAPHLANKFPSELWLLAPTPNLKIYEIYEDKLKNLIVLVTRYSSVASDLYLICLNRLSHKPRTSRPSMSVAPVPVTWSA